MYSQNDLNEIFKSVIIVKMCLVSKYSNKNNKYMSIKNKHNHLLLLIAFCLQLFFVFYINTVITLNFNLTIIAPNALNSL